MKLVAMADIHGNRAPVEAALDAAGHADLVLLLGDITHFGGRRELAEISNKIEVLAELPGRTVGTEPDPP